MAKQGKSIKYTQALVDLICERIATHGVGLKKLCEMFDDMPEKATIRRWRIKYPEFGSQYARAKTQQIETLIDEIIDIADDASEDAIINEHGTKVCNTEFIARSRLRIDTRKWLASKLVPKVYGLNPIGTEAENNLPVPSLKGVTDPNEAAKAYARFMQRGKE